ncbi:ABC-2 type transport system ATP-binding protein [Saccharopolyspora lacisalsi]|uniref:ABC-2 type transport system ATP-binding protein n=1 Tax=Halosaccharopolyspora lacisalsi TaxID=1000566 RepID=A0A839DZZ0_9PSEU|nr:ABC transporter ATP-binding protein [Halosaccharopolyspora lacisalsi]MBA8827512.1 ABC-2 type transport system ATP-binding protein [Halosaccharopolyspora lacisalsi]
MTKTYRQNAPPAVDDISFAVSHGEVFGLLGPNGAGKTTTMGVLTTRTRPTSGSAHVAGASTLRNSIRARERLAVVPQRNNLDRSLNARQNLLFHGAYHGMRSAERTRTADELLRRMGLEQHARFGVEHLSGGQAQRLLIARALMHIPDVLILDEPSTGLDPQARLFVHEHIAELKAEGIAVILCTHDMNEAAKVCDRVGIIDHGRLLRLGSPVELTRSMPGQATLTVAVTLPAGSEESVRTRLSEIPSVRRVERFATAGEGSARPEVDDAETSDAEQFRLYTDTGAATLIPHVVSVLDEFEHALRDMSVGRTSLEDVFIQLTGRELR